MNREIEVKFLVSNLSKIETRLTLLGAHLIQLRILEVNLRFDLPDGSLSREHKVIRLRQDSRVVLTYKGAGEFHEGVRSREEIEVEVSDLHNMKAFLEALGYATKVIYEKYRTTYELGDIKVMLDEMPYGSFIEIEGNSPEEIHATSDQLNLDWGSSLNESYLSLFDMLRSRHGFEFRDLTFANFMGKKISMDLPGVHLADIST